MPEPTTIERQWLEFADNFPGLTRHDDVVPGGRILIEIVPMAKEAA